MNFSIQPDKKCSSVLHKLVGYISGDKMKQFPAFYDYLFGRESRSNLMTNLLFTAKWVVVESWELLYLVPTIVAHKFVEN